MQESELPSEQPEIKAEEDEQTYQMLHELKQDSRLPGNNYPWNQQTNPYENQSPQAAASLAMPKMLPFIGYAQPVLIPFPLYIAPDMFYPAYPGASNDLEEMAMSRSAGDRRASSTAHGSRNSPIYYVRLPPTPYMFVPTNLAAPSPFGSAFSPLLTYQPMPTFSSYGSVFNLPVNFVANGKPSGIYQMHNAANELASFTTGLAGGFNMRPPTPSNPFNYRPISPPAAAQQSFGLAALPVPQQDSKLTSLKRPFVFNGRPEDIYILPNNMNPLYNYNEPNYY
ncbi:CG13857 [Drosophila busckii]|uniref:CG13857 n=2 Tax=Drosophila busckii TaxID=30019 RepID=A0A0M4EGP2_DROBS|nr:CG13857 [Drosophila busckii]